MKRAHKKLFDNLYQAVESEQHFFNIGNSAFAALRGQAINKIADELAALGYDRHECIMWAYEPFMEAMKQGK